MEGRVDHMQSSRQNDTQVALKAESGSIVLRLQDLSQLLQLNPSPFRESALTPEADDYIVRNAKKLPGHQPIRIVIDLPRGAAKPDSKLDVGSALTGHFRGRVIVESEDIRELFRNGRKALVIGFLTLSACLFLAWHFSYNMPARPLTRLMQESFVILGWVSMWKPIEIFLYEWLPLARQRKLLVRLSHAAVTVESERPAKPLSPA
jgi:hypothetical protein